jgi:hypothetical protein
MLLISARNKKREERLYSTIDQFRGKVEPAKFFHHPPLPVNFAVYKVVKLGGL